ncbi:hypothetical protein HMPREF0591_0364 [Mycobacterium parascrofulaceum ATCC BAA-614]|uniref:DUF732 domain-containing protein n=2 Tax=Mycobacterium parascrofulaceum TaxID=240125 RepID=D5P2H0_9MYCO|nr:hypothetical protein HMPREF0591_0364 [Mycobacterium parascrofulaceum ATCC BAA-614]
MMKIAALVATPVIALIAAPLAHADDQAFLNDTQDVFMDPNAKLAAGYHVCTDMRAGMPAQAALHDGFFGFNLINGANVKIVDAAQHDLCPDTLH